MEGQTNNPQPYRFWEKTEYCPYCEKDTKIQCTEGLYPHMMNFNSIEDKVEFDYHIAFKAAMCLECTKILEDEMIIIPKDKVIDEKILVGLKEGLKGVRFPF